ncbi:hypothetical protein AB0I49_16945 [Streptomyces sp. NPDC050617]|uniref:hypothetical protein n=1 Tax=Streptomyces sp. NPDC050617 TaxID=3154628 RepID=UPI003419EEA3
MGKKKDTMAAAKNKIKQDLKSNKEARRTQGSLADREVRLHTPKGPNGRAS